MSDVSQKIKDDMRQTIKDVFGDKDKYHTIDLDVASEVIITEARHGARCDSG